MEQLKANRFSRVSDYLNFVFERRQKERAHFNLEMWSRQLGYKSPRSIAMVLKGQRLPSTEMIYRLGHNLRLSGNEQRYLELLTRLERAKKQGRPTKDLYAELERLSPPLNGRTKLNLTEFNVIAKWYHFAIKQLINTKGFRWEPKWIKRVLRNKVSVLEIKDAVDRLVKLGIVRIDGNQLKIEKQSIITSEDVPSEALRSHHRALIDRAKEALSEQTVDEREINGICLRVAKESVPEAKTYLRDVLRDFEKRFEDKQSNHIYQLNLQLFQHTKYED